MLCGYGYLLQHTVLLQPQGFKKCALYMWSYSNIEI